MVARAETISEPELHGQRRRTSISSAPSVVKKSSSMNSGRGIWSTLMHQEVAEVNGGPTILTDQQLGSSDNLFIIHYSLVIERSARNRNYSPSLGRWINQDPAGYINGANTYQFVMSNPVNAVDPEGTVTLPPGFVGAPPPSPPPSGSLWPPYPSTGAPPGTGWMSFLPVGWGLNFHLSGSASYTSPGGSSGGGSGWVKWQPPFLPPKGPYFCIGGSGTSSGQYGIFFRLVVPFD